MQTQLLEYAVAVESAKNPKHIGIKNLKDGYIETGMSDWEGIYRKLDDFEGWEVWRHGWELRHIYSDYQDCEQVALHELAEIKATTTSYEESSNAIYIPALGDMTVIDKCPDETSRKRPHNYYQILIDGNKIKKEYLMHFLNGSFGQKSLDLLLASTRSNVYARIRKRDIEKLKVSLLSIKDQEEHIRNIEKLEEIKKGIDEIDEILQIRPISSPKEVSKLDQIYESTIGLTKTEKALQ